MIDLVVDHGVDGITVRALGQVVVDPGLVIVLKCDQNFLYETLAVFDCPVWI